MKKLLPLLLLALCGCAQAKAVDRPLVDVIKLLCDEDVICQRDVETARANARLRRAAAAPK